MVNIRQGFLVLSVALHAPQAIGPRVSLNQVPRGAERLAAHLGIHGKGIVGGDVEGRGGPWVAWFPRAMPAAALGPANIPHRYLRLTGPALFSGPSGARGHWHYFNAGILGPQGQDRYRGRPLKRQEVWRIARGWLSHVGARLPLGRARVQVRSGTTFIGGSGLCCFRSLGVVTWGGRRDRFGNVWDPNSAVYMADRGTVVQADLGRLDGGTLGLSHPCHGASAGRPGPVHVGSWCFSYEAAVERMIVADIGNHGTWVHSPRTVVSVSLDSGAKCKSLSQKRLTAQRAVYHVTCETASYLLTAVPAFAGLIGSIWELVRVEIAPKHA